MATIYSKPKATGFLHYSGPPTPKICAVSRKLHSIPPKSNATPTSELNKQQVENIETRKFSVNEVTCIPSDDDSDHDSDSRDEFQPIDEALEEARSIKPSNIVIAMIDLSSDAVPDSVIVSHDAAGQVAIPTQDDIYMEDSDDVTIIRANAGSAGDTNNTPTKDNPTLLDVETTRDKRQTRSISGDTQIPGLRAEQRKVEDSRTPPDGICNDDPADDDGNDFMQMENDYDASKAGSLPSSTSDPETTNDEESEFSYVGKLNRRSRKEDGCYDENAQRGIFVAHLRPPSQLCHPFNRINTRRMQKKHLHERRLHTREILTPPSSPSPSCKTGPSPESRANSNQHFQPKVSNIQFQPLSPGQSFLSATVEIEGKSMEVSQEKFEKLIEDDFGVVVNLDGISLTLLPNTQSSTWLLTAFVNRCNAHRLSISDQTVPMSGSYDSDIQSRAEALLETTIGNGRTFNASTSNGTSSSDDEDGYPTNQIRPHKITKRRRNRVWGLLEEQQVLAWTKEGLSWEEMESRMVGRSKGAIYLRWYTKLRHREGC